MTYQEHTKEYMNNTLNLIPKNKFLKEFGITRHTFTKWVKQRNLPITKVGYRTYIQKDKLDEYTEHGPTDFRRYRLECWIKWKDYLQTPANRWSDKVEKERRLSTVMAVFDIE